MKMIIPKQDKVKRLLLLQLEAHKSQKRSRNEFKRPSPNRIIRNWE
jgi:hypothetical protein